MSSMTRQEILDLLRERQAELKQRGVVHVAIFGSRARGDGRPDSDTDLLIDFDATAEISLFDYVAIKRYLANLIPGDVDVIDRAGLKKALQANVVREAVYAF
jgi:predicted nucleotidyltransferase